MKKNPVFLIPLFLIAAFFIMEDIKVDAILEQRMVASDNKKQWEFEILRSPSTNAIPHGVRANEFRFIKNWGPSQFKRIAEWNPGIVGLAQNTRLAYENIWHASGDELSKAAVGGFKKVISRK